MKFLLAVLLIIVFNLIQVFIRNEVGFYPDNIPVSIMIGMLIGAVSVLLVNKLE